MRTCPEGKVVNPKTQHCIIKGGTTWKLLQAGTPENVTAALAREYAKLQKAVQNLTRCQQQDAEDSAALRDAVASRDALQRQLDDALRQLKNAQTSRNSIERRLKNAHSAKNTAEQSLKSLLEKKSASEQVRNIQSQYQLDVFRKMQPGIVEGTLGWVRGRTIGKTAAQLNAEAELKRRRVEVKKLDDILGDKGENTKISRLKMQMNAEAERLNTEVELKRRRVEVKKLDDILEGRNTKNVKIQQLQHALSERNRTKAENEKALKEADAKIAQLEKQLELTEQAHKNIANTSAVTIQLAESLRDQYKATTESLLRELRRSRP